MDATNGFNAITNLSATGVLAWVVWFTLSRSIPDIIKQFTDEMTQARADFRAEIAAEREHCRLELDRGDQRLSTAVQAIKDAHAS
jgi:hypothetical protein